MSLQAADQFLKDNITCVIATVSEDNQPEAATVGISHDEDWTLLVSTNKKSRKYSNLMKNPKVALTVGFEGHVTLQIEGLAEEVETKTITERIQKHLDKIPQAKPFANDEGQAWFVIKPTWLRFTDYWSKPPIFETKDFS